MMPNKTLVSAVPNYYVFNLINDLSSDHQKTKRKRTRCWGESHVAIKNTRQTTEALLEQISEMFQERPSSLQCSLLVVQGAPQESSMCHLCREPPPRVMCSVGRANFRGSRGSRGDLHLRFFFFSLDGPGLSIVALPEVVRYRSQLASCYCRIHPSSPFFFSSFLGSLARFSP